MAKHPLKNTLEMRRLITVRANSYLQKRRINSISTFQKKMANEAPVEKHARDAPLNNSEGQPENTQASNQ